MVLVLVVLEIQIYWITTGGQIVAGGTNADPLGLVFTGKGLSINEDSGTAFMQIEAVMAQE